MFVLECYEGDSDVDSNNCFLISSDLTCICWESQLMACCGWQCCFIFLAFVFVKISFCLLCCMSSVPVSHPTIFHSPFKS